MRWFSGTAWLLVVAAAAVPAAGFLDPAPVRGALLAARDAAAPGKAQDALDRAVVLLDRSGSGSKACLSALARVAKLADAGAPDDTELAARLDESFTAVTGDVDAERDLLAGLAGNTGSSKSDMRILRAVAKADAHLAEAEMRPTTALRAFTAAKAAGVVDAAWRRLKGSKPLRFDGPDFADIALGSHLRLDTDDMLPRNHGAKVFVASLPLPEGAAFDATEGELAFTPTLAHPGRTVRFLFSAERGKRRVWQLVRSRVTSLPEDGETFIRGVVLRSEQDDQDQDVPIDGIAIRIDGTSVPPVRTDAEGRFVIGPIPPEGRRLQADGQDRNGGPATFACVFEDIPLLLGHFIYAGQVNEIPRPIYLPDLGPADGEVVEGQMSRIEDADLGVCLDIAADSARNKDGSAFTGQMFIPRVDRMRTPAALPDFLSPSFVIAIQPGELTFDPPAQITFPNTDGLEPGSETDIWSINPRTGEFEIVGTGRVTDDGMQIVTISGGVRQSSWHAVVPAPPDDTLGGRPNDDSANEPGQQDDDCMGVGSLVRPSSGTLVVAHPLPPLPSPGPAAVDRLVYQSSAAAASPRVAVDFTMPQRASTADHIAVSVKIGGVVQGAQQFVKVARGGSGRVVLYPESGTLASGLYPTEATVTACFRGTSVSGQGSGAIVVRNDQQSEFGAGWTLESLDRLDARGLANPPDGHAYGVLIHEGGGRTLTFGRTAGPIVVGSDQRRGAGNASDQFDYTIDNADGWSWEGVAKSDIAAELPGSSVIGVRSFLDGTLDNVDVLILYSVYGYSAADGHNPLLSQAERAKLIDWVRGGGCVFAVSHGALMTEPFGVISGRNNQPDGLRGPGERAAAIPGRSNPFLEGRAGRAETLSFLHSGYTHTSLGPWARLIYGNANTESVAFIAPHVIAPGSGPVVCGSYPYFFLASDITYSGLPLDNRVFFRNLLSYYSRFRYARRLGAGEFAGPPGEFSKLKRNASSWTRTYPDGSHVEFDNDGRQTARVDRQGRTASYEYEGGRLARIRDHLGNVRSFSHRADGRIDAITLIPAPGGATRTTRLTHEDGAMTAIRDADGGERRFAYDSPYLLSRQWSRHAGRDDAPTSYHYDRPGSLRFLRSLTPEQRARIFANGFQAARSRQSSTSGGAVAAATLSQTRTHTLTQSRDGSSSEAVTVTTDGLGNIASRTDAQGRTTVYGRRPNGLLQFVAYPSGRRIEYTHDALGSLLTTLEIGTGARTTYEYAPGTNWLTKFTDPLGNVTSIGRDESGNPTTVTDPAGKVTTYNWGRDPDTPRTLGQLLSVTTPLGHTTAFEYGSDGNVNAVVDAEGRRTEIRTDAFGNVREVREGVRSDGTANVTTFEYDALNLLRRVIAPDGGRTDMDYHVPYGAVGSAAGGVGPQLARLTDALGRVTRFTFDGDSRLKSKTDPLDGDWTYDYWQDGRLKTMTDAKQQVTAYAYTASGLLASLDPAGADNTIRFDYDGDARLIEGADEDSRLVLTYDLAGRLQTASTDATAGSPQSVLTYDYDLAGRRRSMSAVVGAAPAQVTTYDYNSRSLIETITAPGASAVGFTYDDSGRRATLTLPGGITCNYGYEDTGSPSSIAYAGPGGNLLSIGYDYHPERGLINRITDDTGAHDYAYDPVGRLTGETHANAAFPDSTFTYDRVGNRKQETRAGAPVSYAYNDDHSLRTRGTTSYRYDPNGSQIESLTGSDRKTFAWDGLNRMVGFQQGATTADYRYDALGRRIAKTVNGVTTRYVYDGLDLIYEVDSSGQITARYTHGPGIDQPVLMNRGGQTYSYLLDHLGSVRALADSAGAVQRRFTYEAFGAVLQETGALPNQFGYTSREPDAENGLMFYRARMYEPAAGRFASRDPLGVGQGPNQYGYVLANPVAQTDPSGTEPYDVFVCIRPLKSLGGRGLVSGPDDLGLNTFHAFLCTFTPNGIFCSGQDTEVQPYGPGRAHDEPFDPERCRKLPDATDEQVQCVDRRIRSRDRPFYCLTSWICGGQNCQQWAGSVLIDCGIGVPARNGRK